MSTSTSVAPLGWVYVALVTMIVTDQGLRSTGPQPSCLNTMHTISLKLSTLNPKPALYTVDVANLKIAGSHDYDSWDVFDEAKRLPARHQRPNPNLLPNIGQRTVDSFKVCLTNAYC
ncbi:hypothetical protein F5X96DRAFT_674704 [Biscogniauxia mediterranea]|nr:hypothetical protein F5X96DRAFT_674704 [Biscogniauxia mediterranea]